MCGGAARGRGRVVLPLRGPAMSARTRMYAHLRSGLGVSRYALLSLSLSTHTYVLTDTESTGDASEASAQKRLPSGEIHPVAYIALPALGGSD